jgi:hypothetical protein
MDIVSGIVPEAFVAKIVRERIAIFLLPPP